MRSQSSALAVKSSTQQAPYVTSPIITVSASVKLEIYAIVKYIQMNFGGSAVIFVMSHLILKYLVTIFDETIQQLGRKKSFV